MRLGLRPTRGGRYFVGLLLVVTFAAYNTSNNLIYLMLSVGLAALPVAAAVGYASLRALKLDWTGSEDAYAGTAFQETFGLRSDSRILEAFGVTIDGTATVPLVSDRSEVVRLERLYPRRGAYRGDALRLESSYPLGLFSVVRNVAQERELVVFPSTRPVDGTVLARDTAGRGAGSSSSGGSDDLHGLREYVRGDHVHHIHWRTSARVGELMVRQFGRGLDEQVLLVFDRSVSAAAAAAVAADEAHGGVAPTSSAGFELNVTATASLASHLVASGATFGFVSDELELRPDGGRAHLRRVLAYLAVVEPSVGRDADWVRGLEGRSRAGVRVLAFATPGAPPQTSLPGVVMLDPERVLA